MLMVVVQNMMIMIAVTNKSVVVKSVLFCFGNAYVTAPCELLQISIVTCMDTINAYYYYCCPSTSSCNFFIRNESVSRHQLSTIACCLV